MSYSISEILKECLKNKNYSKYNEFLRMEIISFFVKKIQEKIPSFLYSTTVELLESVELYLEDDDIYIFNYFYDLLKKDYEPEILSGYLTDIYEKIV